MQWSTDTPAPICARYFSPPFPPPAPTLSRHPVHNPMQTSHICLSEPSSWDLGASESVETPKPCSAGAPNV